MQIDAHLDFVDVRHGVRYGHGNPMRRAAEKPYVTGLSQMGIRNVSSTAKDGYEARARNGLGHPVGAPDPQAWGRGGAGAYSRRRALLCHHRHRRFRSVDRARHRHPVSHGGFLYYEVLELLAGLAKRGTIVGIDLVEVAPDYDHTGTTTILAAQILMNLIGRIMHAREADAWAASPMISPGKQCWSQAQAAASAMPSPWVLRGRGRCHHPVQRRRRSCGRERLRRETGRPCCAGM